MRRWFAILCGVLCAVAASQVPTFHQQYLQRLGGHVAELDRAVEQLDMRAARVDKTRYDYIRDFLSNPDQSVQSEGGYLFEMVRRHARLTNSRARLSEMSPIFYGGALVIELEPDIATATVKAFKPALPITIAGAGYAVAGFAVGFLGMMGLLSLLPNPLFRLARAGDKV